MRILQVCPRFDPFAASGSTQVAYMISKMLVEKGHEVTVFTSDMRDRYSIIWDKVRNIRGIKVYHFPSVGKTITRETKLFITPQLVSIAKEVQKFDVIHLHEYRTFQNVFVYHYAKKHGIPYVLQAHGSLLRIAARRRLKWIYDVFFGYRLLKHASKVIALSQIEAQQYKKMGVPKEKIEIIPNGIDLSVYGDLPPKGCFKKKFGIDDDEKIVMYLGRINRFKGIDFLINAFAYLIKGMKYDHAILVIGGPDDGYLGEIKKLIKRHEIKDKVLFTGPLFGRTKVEAYVDASIVASLDSLKEVVFLLVPLEAAACGTPVVVTKSNHVARLIEEGKFGASIEYGNVAELANMLGEMLNNEDLLKQMGFNGRKFVSENYDWNNVARMIKEVYMDVVERRDNAT